ncbi:helix-turn-helix domain-containing protein [Streptomyces javensis]|uniref:Helix-turn-helix domain-containing protein n=1 Tax=Streptomyces javensis TaxID=114698 RepID=A0ABN1XL92_9ACTN
MFETVLRSEAVPPVDRFGYWREHLARTSLPVELSSDHTDAFWMEQRLLRLGAAHVVLSSFDSLIFQRTEKLIAQADPESFRLLLPLDGTIHSFHHRDQVTACRPWELISLDSSRPFKIRSAPHRSVVVGIEIPKALVSLPRAQTNRVIQRPMSGREGIGALLTGFATQLAASDVSQYAFSDGPRLELVVADLVSALFASASDADAPLPPETKRRALTQSIRAFIQRNLRDSQLTPSTIAAAHQISVSYLHRLFHEEGITVAGWIRRQRLERVCHDLADPLLQGLSIYQIAVRCGFTSYAPFSRMFRSVYGIPPKDYRQQAVLRNDHGIRGR